MAKVQLLQRLRLVPAPAPDPLPRPSPKPISSVQDADTRILSFPRGPAPGSRLSPEFVREIGRFAYLWGWPLVNMFNRYTSFKRLWRPLLIGGIAPVAPINRLAMLHDYIGSKQRYITCPARIWSMASASSISAASRSWFRFPISASATGSIKRPISGPTASPRSAPCTAPSPASTSWSAPIGTTTSRRHHAVFRSSTNIGTIVPRVFQQDDKADNAALQPLSNRSSPIRCRSSTAR